MFYLLDEDFHPYIVSRGFSDPTGSGLTGKFDEAGVLRWGRAIEKQRRVARTRVGARDVSTVFMGTDHDWNPGRHVPILFETMVFVEGEPRAQWRYCCRTLALAGHEVVVDSLGGGRRPEPQCGPCAACRRRWLRQEGQERPESEEGAS